MEINCAASECTYSFLGYATEEQRRMKKGLAGTGDNPRLVLCVGTLGMIGIDRFRLAMNWDCSICLAKGNGGVGDTYLLQQL